MTTTKWPNFDIKEFDCKCGCGLNNVEPFFVDRLQIARTAVGYPFKILSGCRCEKHNAAVGGKPTSDHLTGQGADIKCDTSFFRFRMLQMFYKHDLFVRMGVAKTFIHVGMRPDNPREVLWLY